MNASQIRALVGARVSHVGGKQKTSNITQLSKGDTYRQAEGWSLVGTFEDLDVSAIKLSPWQRPDLAKWLSDEHQHEWDALIFAKTDRVFRSAADCIDLARWCEEHSKILILIDDGIKLDYYHTEREQDAFAGAMSKVFLILASVFAEIEGKRFVQRANDRINFLRTTDRFGYGTPPYGYKIVDHQSGKGKALGLDAYQQTVLHWMANRMIEGESIVGLTATLNEMAILAPQDAKRDRNGYPVKGAKWGARKIIAMLTRPSTQGLKMVGDKALLDVNGQPVRVGPPSFDDETWAQLQIAVGLRKKMRYDRVHSVNPQLGIGKCGLCGKNLRQKTQVPASGKTYRYYLCGNSPKACPGVYIRAEILDEAINRTFLQTKGSQKIKVRIWQPGSNHSYELEQTCATIESLREDRAMGLFTTAEDQDKYRTQMQALISRRDDLSSRPIVKAGWIDTESEETYADVWDSSDPAARRQMIIDAGIAYYLSPSGEVVSDSAELAVELSKVSAELGVKPGDSSPL